MSFFSSDEEEDDRSVSILRPVDDQSAFSQPFEEQLLKTTKAVNEDLGKANYFHQQFQHKIKGPVKKQIEVLDPSFDEGMGVFNLVKFQDKEFQNILITFSYLDHEVNKIVEKFNDSFMDPLVTYGLKKDMDEPTGDDITSHGVREMQISRMFPVFKEVFDLLKRTSLIMINIVNQLHSLYYSKERFFKETFKYFDLFSVLETLGKACAVIYTIDLIMKENGAIRDDFNRFKNSIRLMYKEPSRFGVNDIQLRKIEKQLSRYDRTILSGNCFSGTITQTFDQKIDLNFTSNASTKAIKDNSELYDLFSAFFKYYVDRYAEIVTSPTETFERKSLYNIYCLYGLYRRLFPQQEDRNLWKKLWSVQKKLPVIIVGSHLVFLISDYMKDVVQLSRKAMTKDPKDAEAFLMDYIDKKEDVFDKQMHGYYAQFLTWAAQMDSLAGKRAPATDPKGSSHSYHEKGRLLLSGLILASQIKQNLTTFVFLHIKKGVALTTALVKDIATGCMLLKAIKYLLDENQEGFPASYMTNYTISHLTGKLKELKERLVKVKNPKKELVFAIKALEDLLKGPPASLRKSAQLVCLNFFTYKKDKIFKENELDDFKYYLWKTHLLANYQLVFKEITDCTFMYWIRELNPLFLGHISSNPIEMKRFKFLALGFQDCEPQLKSIAHLENKMELYETYKQELLDTLQEHLLRKICQEVDDHLRLLMHTILIEKLKGKNPFEMPTKTIHHFLINGVIEVFGVIIDPVEEVSKHLNETFYNLNVLNLHDYETYEGLRNLAKELFGVDLLKVYLPSQSIEKGNVDILNIMRSISSFVNNFNYNLFTQTFLESKKDSTIINSVGIRQIADSVQTHGVGILNTTANLVYQFILKKFNTFSQFLFDDLVQTPLRRELRMFKENKEQWEGRYPYSRGEMVAKEIKRLGLFEDGRTFLDKFRILITTVGNALGFVRLLRSASLNYLSKQIEFLPYSISFEEDAEINDHFYLELIQAAKLSGVCCGSADSLDDVIKTLKMSFSQKTDYLRILAKVFDGMFSGQDNKHLRMFYLLLPALTLNFVEAMLNMKDRIAKKRAPDAYIFDDGFALGLVYFLRVLGQQNRFDALHWFEEVKKKNDKDLAVLKEMKEREEEQKRLAKKPGYSQYQNPIEDDADFNVQMTFKKTSMFIDEFTNFSHTFNTAKILLKELTTEIQ